MIYILIFTSYVYGGSFLATQEFSSKESCQVALELIKKKSRYEVLDCILK